MADNLTTQSSTPATIPASTVIATDDAGAGGHVQIVKLGISTNGSATPLTADNTDGLLVNLGSNNDVTVTGSVTANAGTNLNTSALATESTLDSRTGGLTETAPANDTASSGLNGRLQRIAQRITSLIAALGSPFQAGGSIGNTTFASTQSGTWTVQPGNTANTTAWKVDGSAVTQPVSAASLPLPSGAGTLAEQQTQTTALQLIDNIVVVEDAAASGGESGVQVFGVRKDSAGTLASTDGDFTPFQMDSSGNVRVNVAAGGAGDGSILDGVSASIKATVLDYTGSNPLAVRLTDTAGDYVGAGAGTQYTEDAASAANPVGTALILIREDGLAGSLTSTDGDNVAARGNNKGELYVKHTDAIPITDNSGSLTVDNAALSVVGGGVEAAAIRVTVASDSTGVLSIDDNGGNISIDDGGNTITVDGTITANAGTNLNTSALALETGGNLAAATTSLSLIDDTVFAEDVAAQAADKGISILAVRRDADTTLVGADNDYAQLQVNANGALKVEAFSGETLPVSLASVPSHAVTNAGTFATQIDGNALTALQLIDNPVIVDDSAFTPATSSVMMAGYQADETSTDSVDEGDAGAARMTLDRKIITTIQPHTAGGLSVFNANTGDTYTALTNSSQAVKASAGQLYGYYIYNPNTSAIYVLIYNIASASVTVGTSTATMVLCIPALAAANLEITNGIVFSTAISIAAATTGGGNGAPTTALECMIFYK